MKAAFLINSESLEVGGFKICFGKLGINIVSDTECFYLVVAAPLNRRTEVGTRQVLQVSHRFQDSRHIIFKSAFVLSVTAKCGACQPAAGLAGPESWRCRPAGPPTCFVSAAAGGGAPGECSLALLHHCGCQQSHFLHNICTLSTYYRLRIDHMAVLGTYGTVSCGNEN